METEEIVVDGKKMIIVTELDSDKYEDGAIISNENISGETNESCRN